MIELKNVSKTYQVGEVSVKALRSVSLTIRTGEFVAIMGASGSGKSTLLHILGLLDTPDSGEYLLFGKDIKSFSDDELAALRSRMAGFVFQQFHLLRRMSTLDNISLPFIYGRREHLGTERAREKLASVGLADRLGHWPSQLSGGQQQRVAIARALVREPRIIFADEPTGNLDSASSREIMQILKGLNEQGKTVVMVTHEQDIAAYADRVIAMRDGRIVSDESRRKGAPAVKAGSDTDDLVQIKTSLWSKDEFAGHVRQAVNAILSNKVRSALSMLGILVGVASVIAMLALGEGAKSSMEERLKSMGSNLLSIRGGSARFHGASQGSGSIARFSMEDVRAIKALKPLVRKAAGQVRGSVQAVYQDNNWSTSLEGVGYDYGDMRAVIPAVGRWFTREEIQTREKVAVIGMTLQEKLFGTQNPVGQTIKLNRINFQVIGIAPEKGFGGPHDQDDVVYIPVTTAMYRVLGKDYLNSIYVEAADAETMKETKDKLDALIRKRHKIARDDEDAFNIRDMTEIQEMLSSTTRTMSLLLGCIAAISLVVGGIGIMNIMLVSVTERTREIGLRKAIGARKADIMMQFLIESVVMTLSGGLMGILAGAGVSGLLAVFAGWTVKISVFSIVLATAFSVFIGVCFGLWPARKAGRLNPVEALRYE